MNAKLNTQKLGKILGPKLGSAGMKQLNTKVRQLNTENIRELELRDSISLCENEFSADDFLIGRTVKDGVEDAMSSGRLTVQLDTNLTHELQMEGLAREFVNRVQRLRKESDFEVADRIEVCFETEDDALRKALDSYGEYIKSEVLAVSLLDNVVVRKSSFGKTGMHFGD